MSVTTSALHHTNDRHINGTQVKSLSNVVSQNIQTSVIRGGACVFKNYPRDAFIVDDAGGITYPATEINGGLIVRIGMITPIIDTLPSAADLVTALQGLATASSYVIGKILNPTPFAITIDAPPDVLLVSGPVNLAGFSVAEVHCVFAQVGVTPQYSAYITQSAWL